MIETLAGVSPSKFEDLREDPSLAEATVVGVKGSGVPDDPTDLAEPSAEELAIARELVRSARARGVAMTGPGGMLKALTKTVIETALDEEMADHLGYDRHGEAAWAAFEEFEEKWGKPYPAIGQLWRNAWEQFVPFLDDDAEIRTVLCSTHAIESLNARYRRAVTVRGHFPTEQAALKCLYLVTRSLDPKGTGQTRWTMRWKPALNAFALTFADRMPAPENL
jgi:transposase-like protein